MALVSFMVELNCPKHGFERFRIKVVKKFNMPPSTIKPRISSRPNPGEISCLVVGRDVSAIDAKKYLIDYLQKRGMWESILSVKLVK